MTGSQIPSADLGTSKEEGYYTIECVNANGRYPKLLKMKKGKVNRPNGLCFRNGRATVSAEELQELRQVKGVWGRQIDLFGKLLKPGRLQQPTVVRHAGQQGGVAHQEVPVNPDERDEKKE